MTPVLFCLFFLFRLFCLFFLFFLRGLDVSPGQVVSLAPWTAKARAEKVCSS